MRAAAALTAVLAFAAAAGATGDPVAAVRSDPADNDTLTRVAGITVGHVTLAERPTGCTVIVTVQGVVAGVDVRGAAPGTRETDLLSPFNTVDRVHAIVLAGGSAFGLDAASGAVQWLEERGVGYPTRAGPVPIVPAAILYDLHVGHGKVRPGAQCGYGAAAAASALPVARGSIGAGAGATVGKAAGPDRAMKGGVGSAAIVMPDGLVVAALVVVNAFGDVIDPASGAVVAGVRTEDGRALADARRLLRTGPTPPARPGENTTLAVVATNATLTKAQAGKLAQMAHDGFARAIWPVHTPLDGDTIFALATGERASGDSLLIVGALAADAVSTAILDAVRNATAAAGVPAIRDLAR